MFRGFLIVLIARILRQFLMGLWWLVVRLLQFMPTLFRWVFGLGSRLPPQIPDPLPYVPPLANTTNTLGIALSVSSFLLVPVAAGMGGAVAGWGAGLSGLVLLIAVGTGGFRRLSAWLTDYESPPIRRAGVRQAEIILPAGRPVDVARDRGFMDAVLHQAPFMMFEVVVTGHNIRLRLTDVCQLMTPNVLQALVHTHYPDAAVKISTGLTSNLPYPRLRRTLYYDLANAFPAPMLTLDRDQQLDPLSTLTQAMDQLREDETVTFVLAVGGQSNTARQVGEQLIVQGGVRPLNQVRHPDTPPTADQLLWGDRSEYAAQQLRVLHQKLDQTLYHAAIWIQIEAPKPQRTWELAQTVDHVMSGYTHLPYNGLRLVAREREKIETVIANPDESQQTDNLTEYIRWRDRYQTRSAPTLILMVDEMLAYWHLPHVELSAARITRLDKVVRTPEAVARLPREFVLGQGYYQGQWRDVSMKYEDRVDHMHIIGRTRMGKTNAAFHMALQDIQNGHCVVVIDPHGENTDKLLQSLLRHIPKRRWGDVVVLRFGNKQYPVPFNPLRQGPEHALGIVNLLEGAFEGKDGPNVSTAMRAAIITLASAPDTVLSDVSRLFWDDAYRASLMKHVTDAETRNFWELQYNPIANPGTRATNYASPVINRLRLLFANPHLKASIDHPNRIDFEALIRQNKIILISPEIPQGSLSHNETNLLGELIINDVARTVMAQKNRQHRVFLYIDEVERFAESSLNRVLSEAGGFGLVGCFINQYESQLGSKLQQALIGNVGTVCTFALGANDVEKVGKYVRPSFAHDDLMGMRRYEAAIRLPVNGRMQPAFTLRPKAPPESYAKPEQVRQWGQRAHELEQQSIARHTPLTRGEVERWWAWREQQAQGGHPPSQASPPDNDGIETIPVDEG